MNETLTVVSVDCCSVARGCPTAVVRLWPSVEEPPLELCGEKPAGPWQFLSDSNQFRIR